jgi:peptidoglycan/xylan/chitin deacetylase (PgdA/CDA1 family)
MKSSNFKHKLSWIIRFVIDTTLLVGLTLSGIIPQAVKASSEASSGSEKTQSGSVGPLADVEYTLTITSAHGTVTKSPNQATYHLGDVVHLTQTPFSGYKFDHWSNTTTGATINPPGGVAITFDDGYLSTYTDVYPYMKSKGIPGTIYVIRSWVDYNEVGLTSSQLQEMDANGWSIANHSFDHPELNTLSEAEQEEELLSCKLFLDGIGLTRASAHVAYPFGVWNTDTLTAMINTGMLTGRGTDGETYDPKTDYILNIPSGSADALSTVEQATDEAVSNHIIYFFHGHVMGDPGELSLADFKAWIDYLAANNIPALTVNDVYARTFSPIDITITGNMSITANYVRTPTISGNAGVSGAVLNYTGGNPVVANASGNYSINVPNGWTGTVTPVKIGYNFSPTSKSYSNVIADQTGQNYTSMVGNTPPVIEEGTEVDVTMSMNGTPTPFSLTLNATDVDVSDTLTWSISSAASHGTASASGTGTSKAISYTPTTDYVGSDSFNVRVSDGTATDTITVNVNMVAATIYALNVSKAGNGSGTVTSSPTGINCGTTCTANFSYNSSVTLTAYPATGSSFTGWSGAGCSGTGSCHVTMGAARTVTATFTLNKYLLTISPEGNGSGTVTSSPSGVNCGSTCSASFDYNTTVTLTANPATGSTFSGWSGLCTGTGSCEVTMSAARSVTATFTLKTFLLTVSTNGGNGSGAITSSPSGVNCGATCSVSFDYDTTVTLTATPANGSTFTGWSGAGCSGSGTCNVNMTDIRSVTAVFTLKTYHLVISKAGSGSGLVTSSPAGIDCGGTCESDHDYNTHVILTAAPATGSTFTGWSGEGCSGTGTCEVTMSAARSVTATFETYLLSISLAGNGSGVVTSSPTGIDCGATCSASFEFNTVVTLTATPVPGSSFTGWSGAGCSGTGTCVVSMDAVKMVIATFRIYFIYLPLISR